MKIVKPYAKIQSLDPWQGAIATQFSKIDGINLLRKIEYEARISHRTEEAITDTSYDKFLRFVVMEKGDFSVTEHASVTVEAVVDRGITHEWVRHRLGAYTQESTRFVNYNKIEDIKFIMPQSLEDNDFGILDDVFSFVERQYNELVRQGNAPQIARSVLPNALASKIIVTYNLRMWRHFFLLRTSREAHPQMREVTIPLLFEFQEKIPILYEDIIPEQKQSINMRMMR